MDVGCVCVNGVFLAPHILRKIKNGMGTFLSLSESYNNNSSFMR